MSKASLAFRRKKKKLEKGEKEKKKRVGRKEKKAIRAVYGIANQLVTIFITYPSTI